MPPTSSLITRALGRARAWKSRMHQRIRSLPIRARLERQGLPLPPAQLIYLVSNTEDVAWFLDSGARAAAQLREVLARHGAALENLGAVLDFGCGVGRVLRHWADLKGPMLCGTDYNPALIAWCRKHLPFAEFQVNGLETGLGWPDASFDLIYALSVFTHLDEPLQSFWIDALTRALRPGGYLFLTTHGEVYLPELSPEEQARFRAGKTIVRGGRREGSNHCAAFHAERAVRDGLARGLEVLEFLPEGARGNPRQDAYLLRKPAVRH
jgi:SAM-dependent methyltransferase